MLRQSSVYDVVRKICYYNHGFEMEIDRWFKCYHYGKAHGEGLEQFERRMLLDDVIGGYRAYHLRNIHKLTMKAKEEFVQSAATLIDEYFEWIDYHSLPEEEKEEYRILEEFQFFCWEIASNIELLNILMKESEEYRETIEDAINDFL